MNGSDASLQLFLDSFTAGDIAEPLASFDDTTPAASILAAMKNSQLEVAGVRHDGMVTAWLMREDREEEETPVCRPFNPASVIVETTPLNEVVQGLNVVPHLFVRSLGQIGGHIARSDLQKPAMRMWLFGLVTISELRVTRLIDQVCPEDSWRKYLSEGRIYKAIELQRDRRRRGQSRALLDCLQFADKGRIVARDERLREQTRFSSKCEVEDFVAALQDLRNNLAHAHDISSDWNVIFDLAINLQRIVLGPPVTNAPSEDPPLKPT